MCRLCDEGKPQDHAPGNEQRWNSRRGFLKAGSAGTVAAGAMAMFQAPGAPRPTTIASPRTAAGMAGAMSSAAAP